MPDLRLVNINKIYPNGFQAVYNFNLDIKEGEFIVLVGPSGCGKSTTLRMIAGLEEITNGDFYVGDKHANQLSPKQRGVAMVFQSYALYPQLTVYDNLGFSLSLEGVDAEVIDQKVKQVAEILGLTDYLYRLPKALSGGQRQRVAVGRAIIRKVDIFLMDEPLSNLDAKQRVSMRAEIVELHRKVGASTIYVTHDQTEAMTMADRIVIMKDGYVQQVGTPKELYFEPANTFVAGFIGEPPMNLVKARVEDGKLIIPESDAVYELKDVHDGDLADQEVFFGVRPEHLKVHHNNEEIIELKTKVELTEMLGDNSNMYLKWGDNNIISKVDPHDVVPIGEEAVLYAQKKNIYLFDKDGKSLMNYQHE
ncbi:MAG: sn-glycerol-3-phosphate ABC transporter ATP-binding protein UgpC [Gammaproteobacteria bacterium]|nr:sn-glycerol-3-phosphate ABC transporter ATP-binding protein UgpC [Gammaproteobacteria bacterium]